MQAQVGHARESAGSAVDVQALRACTAAALERDESNGEFCDGSGVAEWEKRWQVPFGSGRAAVQGSGAGEWHTGSWDAAKDAKSVHIVREIRGEGEVERGGGEASGWGESDWGDGNKGLGEDGYARGWEERAQHY